MILLDTNALLWLGTGHRRARPLVGLKNLFVSPMTLLELQLLTEAGRLRLKRGVTIDSVSRDDRWLVDEPPAGRWFEEARSLGWTRDIFDRLIVAHALVRGFRLATGDAAILEHLEKRRAVEL